MNVFELRETLIREYASYVASFIEMRDQRIRDRVQQELEQDLLWPNPLIQLNPSFQPGESIDELVDQGLLHDECRRIFRVKRDPAAPSQPLRPHRHQVDAIRVAQLRSNHRRGLKSRLP